MDAIAERRAVVTALKSRFPISPEATIERLVLGEMETHRDAKVHTFVPILVQRSVAKRLKDTNMTDGGVSRATSPR
jgi:hypothetical protein